MFAKMRWANWEALLEPTFLLQTFEINKLETSLKAPLSSSIHPSRRFEYPWVCLNLMNAGNNNNKTILDVGTGKNVLPFLLAEVFKTVHALDIDHDCVKWLTETSKQYKNMTAKQGDIISLPYGNEAFDNVMCISVLEHLPNDKIVKALQELFRVTRPNGVIYLTMDVAKGQHGSCIGFDQFLKLAAIMGLDVPDHKSAIELYLDDTFYIIACVVVQKSDEPWVDVINTRMW